MEKRKINYFIATAVLFAVCLLGQILCDGLGYECILGWYFLRIVIFCIICAGVCLLVHFLYKPGKVRRILSWVFHILMVALAGIVLLAAIIFAVDDVVYIGDGWSLSIATISEDFQYMNSLTHWIGRGDDYYKYSDEDAIPISEELKDREKEPYLSAMLERSKALNIYCDYHGETLLNVVGYMYGRWYVALYIAVMLYWSISAVLILTMQKRRVRFAFMLVMLIPVMVSGWGIVLNAFGLCYICLIPAFAYSYSVVDTLLAHWPFMIVFTVEMLCIEKWEMHNMFLSKLFGKKKRTNPMEIDADSGEFQAAYTTLSGVKVYPKPIGYKEMAFNGLKFYYCDEKVDYTSHDPQGTSQLENYGFEHDHDITDSQRIYKNKAGKRALVVYVSVPTFDSGDREWDSYKKLFLISEKDGMRGFLVSGGYKIAQILAYEDIRYADDKTESLLDEIIN